MNDEIIKDDDEGIYKSSEYRPFRNDEPFPDMLTYRVLKLLLTEEYLRGLQRFIW